MAQGSFVQLVRNEDYHVKGMPYLDEMYFQFIPDAAARAVAYETGKCRRADRRLGRDLRRAAALQAAEHLRDHKGLGDVRARTPGSRPTTAQAPDGNKPFRQAMMYAIDRDFAKDVIWSGYGKSRPAR